MGQARFRFQLSAAALACGITTTALAAPPTPAQMLGFQPKQPGVVCAMPTEAEAAAYKVELVSGPGSASGWAMKDTRGQLVRKFVASKGAKASIDIWSYYLDGQEVYRELDTSGAKKANEFRWLGVNGMRWGVDVNGDGKIDGWKMISAEEVSQELLKAIVTRDVARFHALLINEAEIKNLEVGQPEADHIRQSVMAAPAKFAQTVQALSNLSQQTQWVHLEAPPPQCIPADATGGKLDLIHYQGANILYQNGEKHDWINIGEIIQVGHAWRLVAAPSPGATPDETPSKIPQALLTELGQIDKSAPQPGATGAIVAKYNLDRAAVLEKIVSSTQGKDEAWIKQLADCLSTAWQFSAPGDKAAHLRLVSLKDNVVKAMPGSPLAGYVAFRELSADFAVKQSALKSSDDVKKFQEAMRESYKAFVAAYPTAEDTPDAALNIGMISEFLNDDAEAKTWYTRLTANNAQGPTAVKAAGALRRLALEGKPLELAGPTFAGGQFNIAQLQNKVVVVYYWASWNKSKESDLAKLRDYMKTYGPKGVELVTVNLDENQNDAVGILQKAQIPGQHIWGQGGTNGALGTYYGIMVMPTVFIVGRDGRVASRTVQLNTLEDEIKKLTDK